MGELDLDMKVERVVDAHSASIDAFGVAFGVMDEKSFADFIVCSLAS